MKLIDQILAFHAKQALEKCNWNKDTAAKLLGVSRRTIYRMIEKYNLHKEYKQISYAKAEYELLSECHANAAAIFRLTDSHEKTI